MKFDIDGFDIVLMIIVSAVAWGWIKAGESCVDHCEKKGLYGEVRSSTGCALEPGSTCVCRDATKK